MDTNRLLELLGHYVVMLILIFGLLEVIGRTIGPLDFWVELAVVVVIAFAYRPIVVQLGVAPESWKPEEE